MSQEWANRLLETRDPKQLLIVTQEHLDKYPEHKALLEKYYDKRADTPVEQDFVNAVKEFGAIHSPVFITHVEELGKDVVIAGRRRVRAAIQAGFQEVPVITHSNEDKLNALLELSENLSRRENTAVESAYAYRKAMRTGLTQEEIAGKIGVTPATISYTLTIGDMPKVVHDYISKGKLTNTAALTLSKSLGKKAAPASGVTRVYDEKEVKAALEAMDEKARLAGGKADAKITVEQARASKPTHVEGLSAKEWDALIADESVPKEAMLLISVFRNKLSPAQAVQQADGKLSWLRKITPQPKPKKVKEPKIKPEKKGKKTEAVTETPAQAQATKDDIKSLFSAV